MSGIGVETKKSSPMHLWNLKEALQPERLKDGFTAKGLLNDEEDEEPKSNQDFFNEIAKYCEEAARKYLVFVQNIYQKRLGDVAKTYANVMNHMFTTLILSTTRQNASLAFMMATAKKLSASHDFLAAEMVRTKHIIKPDKIVELAMQLAASSSNPSRQE